MIMLKAQIVNELAAVKEQMRILREQDNTKRKYLTDFLGASHVKSDRWGTRTEEILSWNEIYFELGKIMQRRIELATVIELQEQQKFIFEQLHKLNKKIFPDDVRIPGPYPLNK